MIEKDYVMRMIQNLAIAMARIVKAQGANDRSLAEQEVEKAYRGIFGTPAAPWRSLDAGSILALVKDDLQLRALAMLFTEEAFLRVEAGEGAQARPLLVKASRIADALLDRSRDEDRELRKYRRKIEDLADRC